MLCADCNRKLAPYTLTGYGQRIEIDYCGHCGGIWTDNGESNFLNDSTLAGLTDLLPETATPDLITQQHYCPRDRSIMSIFRGENISYGLTIFTCPKCAGLWFPFRSLEKWQNAQFSKINSKIQWKIPLHSIYSLGLPLLLLIILASGLMAVLSGVSRNTDTRIKAQTPISKPLAIQSGSDSMIIGFNTEKMVTTKIRYWQRANSKTETWVSNTPKKNHTVELKNLNSGGNYSYQLLVEGEENLESPIYTFTLKNNFR